MIEVDELVFRYPGASAPVIAGATFAIDAGERVAVVGANAAGKTTLARFVAGLLPEEALVAERGEVRMDGRPWPSWSLLERAEAVQFVGQIPAQQLSGCAFTVYDELAFGPCNLALPEREIRARVEDALERCNLRHLAHRDPFTLSGGEQQRLSLGAALAMRPRVLVLDEPTSNLDPESRDAFVRQLAALPASLTVIVFEVATRPAMAMASRFLFFDDGVVAGDGAAAAILTDPRCTERLGAMPMVQVGTTLRDAGAWPVESPLAVTVEDARSVLEEMRNAARR